MSSRPTEGEPISKTNKINYLTVTNLNRTFIDPRSPTKFLVIHVFTITHTQFSICTHFKKKKSQTLSHDQTTGMFQWKKSNTLLANSITKATPDT